MAKQTINVGATANDKKGDSLRAAFQKVNANFSELYTALGLDSGGLNLGAFEFTGSTISTTDSSGITIDQSVTVSSDLTVGGDVLPGVANGGNLGSLAKPFKSLYVSNSTVYFGGVPLAINQSGQLTVNGSQVGSSIAWADITGKPTIPSAGDITFANSTITAGNDDEIIVQAKDTNGFATARLNLEPVYGETSLSAYSTETVETFTLANGDFAAGVWQNNGFGVGVVAFTGAQNIGDFFQNTLMSLTAANVSITINSESAFTWNGGTNGSGTDTPGFGTSPITPPSPITITSIVFRYRTQSKISVNQGNTEIRLTAQDASIEMSADQNVRVFADNQIEIQSGDTLSISAGESISISNGSSDSISISTGDLNITAFDDVNFRGSDSFRLRNTSATAPIRIITDDNNTQRTWAFNPDGNLTLPGNLHSEGDISIEINLADSTRRIWRFGEDGDLAFPDGTSQSSAGISASSTDTLTNKTINIQAGQGNVFQIQGNSITSYSGSGAVLALTSMPTFSGMNVNNSSLSMDGGSGSYYWAPTFADGTGTIHKAGVYKSAADANNSLFSFGANGAGTMSVVMDGSLFVGSSLPSNNGGLNTNYGGWLVVQAGAKFGGDLNTIGNFILDTPGNYVRFGDGTTQTTAADFGYLDLDKDTIKGTAGYQYTFATDGYFTSSTSSESTNYFFVAYNTTNANIAAGWTVVGGTANTTVSSVTYPVAGYPGVIRVNLTAAASSTSGFYPVTVTSPDRLRVEIQPNPGTSDKFAFTTSGLTFPDGTATVGKTITVPEDEDFNITLQHDFLDGAGPLPFSFSVSYDSITLLNGNGKIITGSTAGNNEWALDAANKNLSFPNNDLILYNGSLAGEGLDYGLRLLTYTKPVIVTSGQTQSWTFGTDGNLTLPGDIRSEREINIDINLSDSTLRRWRFGEDGNLNLAGNLQFPNGPEIRDVNGDLRLRAAPGEVAQLQGLDISGFVDSAVKVFYDNGSFVTINTNIDAGAPEQIWTFDSNGKLTLPGILELSNGAQIFNTAGIDNSITIGATGTSGTTTFNGAGFFNDDVYFHKAIQEKFTTLQDATGTVTHDCANGSIFYHTSPDANWTVNLTNFTGSLNYATTVTLIISQGGTGYYPNALEIGGAAQTINWQGNTNPTPSSNRVDVVSFSIYRTGAGYTVLGQLTGF